MKRITSIIRGKSGAVVLLADVANVVETPDPNQINRENVARRIVVSRNAQGRDLGGTVKAIQESIAMDVLPSLPGGYSITYGGQFESQQRATQLLLILARFRWLPCSRSCTRTSSPWLWRGRSC